MALNQDFVDFVSDQLSEVENFEPKRMFGGIGFFREAIMFALLSKSNVFYLRGDDTTRANFENLGMTNFMASENKKGMPYWEVPVDILEHKGELKNWAELAYSVALKHKK